MLYSATESETVWFTMLWYTGRHTFSTKLLFYQLFSCLFPMGLQQFGVKSCSTFQSLCSSIMTLQHTFVAQSKVTVVASVVMWRLPHLISQISTPSPMREREREGWVCEIYGLLGSKLMALIYRELLVNTNSAKSVSDILQTKKCHWHLL